MASIVNFNLSRYLLISNIRNQRNLAELSPDNLRNLEGVQENLERRLRIRLYENHSLRSHVSFGLRQALKARFLQTMRLQVLRLQNSLSEENQRHLSPILQRSEDQLTRDIQSENPTQNTIQTLKNANWQIFFLALYLKAKKKIQKPIKNLAIASGILVTQKLLVDKIEPLISQKSPIILWQNGLSMSSLLLFGK